MLAISLTCLNRRQSIKQMRNRKRRKLPRHVGNVAAERPSVCAGPVDGFESRKWPANRSSSLLFKEPLRRLDQNWKTSKT